MTLFSSVFCTIYAYFRLGFHLLTIIYDMIVILVSTSAGSVRPIPGDGESRPAHSGHLRSPRHQGQIENQEVRKFQEILINVIK